MRGPTRNPPDLLPEDVRTCLLDALSRYRTWTDGLSPEARRLVNPFLPEFVAAVRDFVRTASLNTNSREPALSRPCEEER